MNLSAAKTSPATMTGTCGRCDGSGRIRGFSHYANGVCFACKGTGSLPVEMSEAAPKTAREIEMAAESARKSAWIEAQADADPVALAARFARMDWRRVNEIRNSCPESTGPRDSRGGRVCYWAASTALNAWPIGRAYPLSWIDESGD